MMNRTPPGPRGALRCAEDVTVTRLPFGGAVLINGRTLALLECAEPDAAVLAALLADPAQRQPHNDQMAAVLEHTASCLLDDGWLVAAPNGGDGR
jgi:hypothetical protein